MSKIYEGEGRRLFAAIRNVNKRLVDPTSLTLELRKPGQEPVTYTYPDDAIIVKDGVGQYHADITLTPAGAWTYVFIIGTGTGIFQKSRSFYVRATA